MVYDNSVLRISLFAIPPTKIKNVYEYTKIHLIKLIKFIPSKSKLGQ